MRIGKIFVGIEKSVLWKCPVRYNTEKANNGERIMYMFYIEKKDGSRPWIEFVDDRIDMLSKFNEYEKGDDEVRIFDIPMKEIACLDIKIVEHYVKEELEKKPDGDAQ